MKRGDVILAMADAMIARGHNISWIDRAETALSAIRIDAGGAVVDGRELEKFKCVYGFELLDLTVPPE